MKNEAWRGSDNKDCGSKHGLYKCHEIVDEALHVAVCNI